MTHTESPLSSRPIVPIEHLYFHIPFCPKLCPYCSFYVETGGKNKTRQFVDALLKEVEKSTLSLQPRTIYFGGGTPSALSVDQLTYLSHQLRARVDMGALEEWTIEANPSTVSEEKARALREVGITRISLGVQSWDDLLLKTLGRTHSARQAERTFALLRHVEFADINIDLMFGIPGQTLEQWRATLARTIALAPAHISTYCLTYEEDTDYFRKLQAGAFRQDDERDALFFEMAIDALTSAGYAHYEISNYARPGYESRHNRAYWNGADYLGFGPSAFSTVGLRRWQNIPDTAEYMRRVCAGENISSFEEALTSEVRRGEIIAFGLRTEAGIAAAELRPWAAEVGEFRELGFVEERDNRVMLTRRGKLMADSVGAAFVHV
jgi:oxygen-independent coproporphyrinogen-3 oxidase